jgi:hypothetical protein
VEADRRKARRRQDRRDSCEKLEGRHHAVLGALAAPVLFAVGAIGSIGTKRLLRKLTTKKG